MSVSFVEWEGSPVFRGSKSELSATRIGEIDWGDINAFYQELFPPPFGMYTKAPAKMPGGTSLYADNVTFEPLFDEHLIASTTGTGVASPINVFTKAKVTIEYKTWPYEQDEDSDGNPTSQLITRRKTVGGQILTMPNNHLKWTASGLEIKNPEVVAGKFIGTIDHELTLHMFPATALPTLYIAVRGLVGLINNAEFEGAAIGTLLFLGADIQATVGSDGNQTSQVTLKFQERNVDGDTTITWNHFFCPTAPAGWYAVETLDNNPVFASGNFSVLITGYGP